MKNILFLEDNENLGSTLVARLQDEKLNVFWAKTVSDGRQIIEKEEIAVAIVDVGLPDGDGLSFASEYLKPRAVPFIFLTAQNSAENRLDGYELGAADFIPKPFHFKELLLRLQRVLETAVNKNRVVADGFTLNVDAATVELKNGKTIACHARDFNLLKVLVEQSPKIVSRAEMLAALGAEDASTRGIDNSIVRIRQMLGDKLSAPLRSVRGVGYQWVK